MCGIVGIAGDLSREECLAHLAKMNGAIVHRGPDDDGIWAEDGFGFAMRRLSIIDLAGGKQPIWDEASERGIVFNGEVYNYRSLRSVLDLNGSSGWTTESDTEVVLRTLVKKGEKGIHDFNGMFAFATWDKRSKSLLLVRDRMGVKPLYYFWDGKTLIFASEIKAILSTGIVEPKIDHQSLWDYLTYRYVPGPNTIWQNIYKLPPGHLLRYRLGTAPEIEKYWACDVVENEFAGQTEKEIDAEFESLFLDAVELRLVASDVPVGLFLSGGLDSSAIAAAALELGHKAFHTFSVGFEEGGYYSELKYARKVADHVDAKYHEVVLDQKTFIAMLPDMVTATDEPMADLSTISVLAVSRLAHQYVKVVLSGEGSDEILAGYEFSESEKFWDRIRLLQKMPEMALRLGTTFSRVGPDRFHRGMKKVATLPLKEWNRVQTPHISMLFSDEEKQRLLPELMAKPSERIIFEQYATARSNDPLQQALSVYQKDWLVEDLLMKADKATMSTSLEARTPFLDYRLVEWANRQPNSVKVKRLGLYSYETKSVLRRFCRSRLPREIIERPKRGFPDPANLWLRNGLEGWARDTILARNSWAASAFQRKVVEGELAAAVNGDRHAAGKIWALIVLEFWMRKWMDPPAR
ncbi:MAG TPA: asparagine synthase (glutamine-hydrolyzing) [Pyrinomonadaceae bacterium]|nr:asparagine synthase (glutamine-hydrolyzing) [Pyrinomonadaceae bacterium]